MTKNNTIIPASEYVFVTPELAKEWLAANTSNRKLRRKRVEALVKKIKAGKWQTNHQAIGFGTDGLLYDGQHRLTAITQAGVGVWVLVVKNLTPESRMSIDEVLARTASENHNLAMKASTGEDQVSAHEGQVLRILWMQDLAVKTHTSWRVSGTSFSASDLTTTLAKHRAGFDAIMRGETKLKGRNTPLSRAGVVAAFIYAYPMLTTAVAEAHKDLIEGAGLSVTDPIWLLREMLLNSKGKNARAGNLQTVDFDLTLTAIKARSDKREVRMLRVADTAVYAFEQFHSKQDMANA